MSTTFTALTRPLRGTLHLRSAITAGPSTLVHSRFSRPSRPNSSSSSSSGGNSIKDPSHPYLHYHPLSTGSLALSFLSHPPASATSRTVLGQIPAGAAGPGDFAENKEFVRVLHDAIKEGLGKGKGEAAEFEAAGRPGDGYIHITDERAIPPAGRIGETEDLIGSVFVENGKIIASTYEPLPSYRLITGNGPLLLPKGLDKHLIETLEKIDAEEQGR